MDDATSAERAERPTDLLVIGRFARSSGLTVGALRHYDEVGLMAPAWTDPETGYRSYRRDQLETARTIVHLRDLEMSLESIRAYFAASDDDARRRTLDDHRRALEARTFRLQRVLHIVRRAADPNRTEEIDAMTTPVIDPLTTIDATTHRAIAVELFNHVWRLLERSDRSAGETDEMIHAAHASRFHWSRADGSEPVNLGRGEWQCSRVYAVLGRAEPAIWHARRCLDYASGPGARDWDIAAAYEALARAHAIGGDPVAAAEWKSKAVVAVTAVEDPDEREVIEGDIATLPI
jgi:DNA-binding transcriptional MerR regulator